MLSRDRFKVRHVFHPPTIGACLCAAVMSFGCQGLVATGGGGSGGNGTSGLGGTTGVPGTPGSGATTGTAGSGGTGTTGSGSTTGTPGSGGTAVTTGSGGMTGIMGDLAALCAQAAGTLKVGRTPLRRLTRSQFNNTVRDLLGSTGTPANAISPDERIGPFFSNAIAPITDLVVQQTGEVAATLAAQSVARMAQIAPCDLAADTTTTCATRFITEFGAKVYRRPLDTAERDKYLALYTMERGAGTAQTAFQLIVETMLQAPSFLYHSDVSAGAAAPTSAPVRLSPQQLASRLSYFLWDSMPDATLSVAATNSTLLDTTVLAAQVDRMLLDARATDTVPAFHLQWLGLGDMSGIEKDPVRFPQFNAALVDAMRAETAAFSDFVVRRGDGLMSTLFNGGFTFPQGALFQLYGLTMPAGFKVGDQMATKATERAGLLTQAAFLTKQAHRDQTSPVHRGIFVRENILCQPLMDPPPGVSTTPPAVSDVTTTRTRFTAHQANPACGGCHILIDPIGLGFENYDAIGAYRAKDGTMDVDASGEVKGATGILAGPFVGAIELSKKLGASPEAASCLGNQWFRFSLGRMESNDDACSMKAIQEGFAASGGNVRQLLSKIVQSDAFRYVRATQ